MPRNDRGDGRTFTEEARRRQIVAAAIATVNELGYHRASLAEIARRAGVAKSALVYYFGSKDALLLHVLDSVFHGLGVEVEEAVARESLPDARLHAYAQTYLSYVGAHRRELAAAIDIVVSHRGADGVALYLTGSDEDTALLRSILSAGIEVGTFRPMPLAVAVSIVEGLLDLAITAVQRDFDADLGVLTPEILAVLDRGLRTDGGAVTPLR